MLELSNTENHKNRPSLPAVFVCALIFWFCTSMVFCQFKNISVQVCILASIGGIIALACIILKWAIGNTRNCYSNCLFAGFVGLLLGIICGGFGAANLHLQIASIEANHYSGKIRALCIEDASYGDYGSYCDAILLEGAYCGSKITFEIDGIDSNSIRGLRVGDVVSSKCTLSSPSEDSLEYCWEKGVVAYANLSQYELEALPGVFQVPFFARNASIDMLLSKNDNLIGGNSCSTNTAISVLLALLCGFRAPLTQTSSYYQFQIAGLAHLVAVSGAHLSLVSSLMASILALLHINKKYSICFQIVFMFLFVLYAGMPISAVRSYIMAMCCLLSWYTQRRSSSLSALGVCIIVMIALNPANAVSTSFVLSAASTIGIVLFTPLLSEVFQKWNPCMPQVIRDSLSLTLSANLCTQLYAASLFCRLSIISPLSNCIIAPIFSAVCIVGIVLLSISLLLPLISDIAIFVSALFCYALSEIVKDFAIIPFACIPVDLNMICAFAITISVCLVLYLIWPIPSLRSFCCAILPSCFVSLLVLVYLNQNTSDELIMLDVGQGDAIVIRSEGSTVMIDTGTEDSLLLRAMARNDIFKLNALFVSHPDDDHCGSLATLYSMAQPNYVFVPLDLLSCDDNSCTTFKNEAIELSGGDSVNGLLPGDVITCGAFSLEVVWPDKYTDSGGNSDSLCLYCKHDGNKDGDPDASMLLCGDAESETLNILLSQKRISRVDVLKVGHHGSKSSVDEKLAKALDPQISLISVGYGNDYGHPSKQTVSILEQQGSKIFRTDLQGDLTCSFTSDGIEVHTLR